MKKRPVFFLAGLAVCALAAVPAGCRSPEAELAAYFGRDTFWEGRGTPRQYMTDRIVDAKTIRLVEDLSSSEKKRRTEAFEELSRLRDLMEFGRKWSLPALEIRPAEAKTPPVIDGRIDREEWKDTVEISGSCRAGRMRRNFDATRLLFKYDKDFLYLALGFPLAADPTGKRRATSDDHALVYFDTPGGSARYFECIFSPARGGLAAVIRWTYCGNGSSEQLAPIPGSHNIRSALVETSYGCSLEMAIPRTLLKIDGNSCCRLNVLFWDSELRDYRTCTAIPYQCHDIFNRLRIRLP